MPQPEQHQRESSERPGHELPDRPDREPGNPPFRPGHHPRLEHPELGVLQPVGYPAFQEVRNDNVVDRNQNAGDAPDERYGQENQKRSVSQQPRRFTIDFVPVISKRPNSSYNEQHRDPVVEQALHGS